jgi:hypothetical protein
VVLEAGKSKNNALAQVVSSMDCFLVRRQHFLVGSSHGEKGEEFPYSLSFKGNIPVYEDSIPIIKPLSNVIILRCRISIYGYWNIQIIVYVNITSFNHFLINECCG